MATELSRPHRLWRARILTATWFSYAGFYICRKNFFVAKTSVQDSLDITTSELAHLYTAYLVAYMAGQFVVGWLGQRTAARWLLLAGMALTLVCNLVFGAAYLMGPAGYGPMVVFMVINGLAQATGWPGNVGILSGWLRRAERGRIMALWATSYQFGSGLAKAFAALMLGYLGATWSFWGAALVMFALWLLFYRWGRDQPEDVGLEPLVQEIEVPAAAEGARGQRAEAGAATFAFTIVSMGAVYFVFKFIRYALDSWAPLAIEQLFGTQNYFAGAIASVFDWVGFLGVLFAGWASDRYFGGRRHQVIVFMTAGMLGAFWLLSAVGLSSLWVFAACLALCGFLLMGPDSLLAGVGAIDVASRGKAIVAAGVINGIGSIGPIFQEEIIGWLLDRSGFQATFDLLLVMCFVGLGGTCYLSWRSRRGLSSL
jgi:sugar phosphate permease